MGPHTAIGADGAEAVGNGLSVHHHAQAAAVGIIVHLLLLIEGIVPDLVTADIQQALGLSAADDAFVQHGAAHIREQGEQIDSHASNSPSRGRSRMTSASKFTSTITDGIAGMRISRPSSIAM